MSVNWLNPDDTYVQLVYQHEI